MPNESPPEPARPDPARLARLRLVAAAAHALPASRVDLVMDTGGVVRVSRNHGDRPMLTPCLLRHATAAHVAGDADAPGWVASVVEARLTGCDIEDLGGGLLRASVAGHRFVCFVTLLDPDRVRELLDGAEPPHVPADAVRARVCPDADLAVTLVAIEPRHPALSGGLVTAARWAQERCLLAELRAELDLGTAALDGAR